MKTKLIADIPRMFGGTLQTVALLEDDIFTIRTQIAKTDVLGAPTGISKVKSVLFTRHLSEIQQFRATVTGPKKVRLDILLSNGEVAVAPDLDAHQWVAKHLNQFIDPNYLASTPVFIEAPGMLLPIEAIGFDIYRKRVVISVPKNANVGLTGNYHEDDGDLILDELLEDSVGFSLEQVSGGVDKHTFTKKSVRPGAVAVLPVLPLITLATPLKKEVGSFEVDNRVYLFQLAGKSWSVQARVVAASGNLERISKLQVELQRALNA